MSPLPDNAAIEGPRLGSPRDYFDASDVREVVSPICCALLLWYTIACCGAVQFGGADGGFLSNCGWQAYLGRRPYKDFVTAVPPGFVIGAGMAMWWFGVCYTAFAKMAAWYTVAMFAVHWYVLKRLLLPYPTRLLVALLTQAVTMVEASLWWYNPIANSTAAVFLSVALAFAMGPVDRTLRTVFTVMACLLFLAKINVTLATAGVALLLVLLSPQRRVGIALMGLAALLASGVLAIAGIDVIELLRSYRLASNRVSASGNAFRFIYGDHRELSARALVSCVPAIAVYLALLWALISRSANKCHQLVPMVAVFAIPAAAVVSALTNNDDPASSLSIFFAGFVAMFVALRRAGIPAVASRWHSRMFWAAAILAVGHGFEVAIDRSLPKHSGSMTFYEMGPPWSSPLVRASADSFFKGMRVSGRLVYVEKQIRDIVQAFSYLGDAEAPVFFGPRIDWGFAACGIHNQRGMPLWWNAYGEMNAEAEDACVDQFIRNKYKVCIFMKRDYPYFPERLLRYLFDEYRVYDTDVLTIHFSKDLVLPKGIVATPVVR